MFIEMLTALAIEGSVVKTNRPGLGILGVRINSATRKIIKVHDKGAAKEAGLLAGDKILWVYENNNKLRPGDPGEEVKLTILRKSDTFDVTVVRKDVREMESKELNQYFGGI
jgi:C-terminal processing protease CtpA/Prc